MIVLPATGLLTPVEALLMGLALVAFQLEELVRRVFMATMRFWRLVIIDSAAVLSAFALVGIWALIEPVAITTFFIALGVGQLIGIVVGVAMLPTTERTLVSLRGMRDQDRRRVRGLARGAGLHRAADPHRDAGRR